MSHDDDFDPYRKWLGIPPHKRPPTYYDLLAIGLNEDDHEVIHTAAEQRRASVEKHRGTGRDQAVAGLIYQIEEAELVLLDSEKRRDYDKRIRVFRKRSKSRRVERARTSGYRSRAGGSTGEDPGIVITFAKIVAILAIAFVLVAAVSFSMPWERLDRPAGARVVQRDAPPPAAALPAQPAAPPQVNPVAAPAPLIDLGPAAAVADKQEPPMQPAAPVPAVAKVAEPPEVEKKPSPDDVLEGLHGRWVVTAESAKNGPDDPANIRKRNKELVVIGKKFQITYESVKADSDYKNEETGRIELDVEQQPMTLDLYYANPRGIELVYRGIVRLEDDQLVHRFVKAKPSSLEPKRPSSFSQPITVGWENVYVRDESGRPLPKLP